MTDNSDDILNTGDGVPDPTPKVEPPQPPASDPYEEMLNGIQDREGRRKYATTSDALRSITHKEDHIVRLEAENALLREKAEQAKTLDDVLTQLNQNADGTARPATPGPEVTQQQQVSNGKMTEDDIVAIMQRQEARMAAKKNVGEFNAALKDKYGEKAKDVFAEAMKAKGFDKDFIQQAAARNPEAAITLLGLNADPVGGVNTSTQYNTSAESAPQVTDLKDKPLESQERFDAIKADTIARLKKDGLI
jgi:hypothetical protein